MIQPTHFTNLGKKKPLLPTLKTKEKFLCWWPYSTSTSMSGSGAATTLHSLLQMVRSVTRLVQSDVNNACMHVYIYIYICIPIPTGQSIPMTIVNLCADYSCTLHFSLSSSIFLYSFEHPALSLASLMFEILQCFFLFCTVCKNYGVVETPDRRQVWN